ncbi:MAG: Fur family transcriptional regulator [Planctomycetales bacterium]
MVELSSVTVAASPAEKFREYLATQGQRLTPERAAIVEEVFSDHEHFDAEELVERLTRRNNRRRVSRPTVYRTLKSMEQAGLLRKVARTDGRDVYEHDYGYPQHDHLICKKCGALIEFHNAGIRTILEEIAADRGFRMSGHRLEVHGLCDDCCRPPTRSHRLPGTV